MREALPSVHVVVGPTASGKSRYALDLALSQGGEIINADSVQLYRDLLIVSARPKVHQMMGIPHHLYGILGAQEISSAQMWVDRCVRVLNDIIGRNRYPIIVGGTGFYIQALTQGLSPIPPISNEVRSFVEGLQNNLDEDAFFKECYQKDPLIAFNLHPNDTHRLKRALEVMLSTGRSLFEWHKEKRQTYAFNFHIHNIEINRPLLVELINKRVLEMIEEGAIQEVETFLDREDSLESPLFHAIGVQELGAYLRGESLKEEAIQKMRQRTCQYAKRQTTWFRHHI